MHRVYDGMRWNLFIAFEYCDPSDLVTLRLCSLTYLWFCDPVDVTKILQALQIGQVEMASKKALQAGIRPKALVHKVKQRTSFSLNAYCTQWKVTKDSESEIGIMDGSSRNGRSHRECHDGKSQCCWTVFKPQIQKHWGMGVMTASETFGCRALESEGWWLGCSSNMLFRLNKALDIFILEFHLLLELPRNCIDLAAAPNLLVWNCEQNYILWLL